MHVDTHIHIQHNLWPWCQCILGAALIYHNTYLSDRKPQLICGHQSLCARTHKHTHISHFLWCVARALCLSQGYTSQTEPKHTQTNAHKDALSLPVVNSLLYNLHLLKHMEGQVIMNQRKHLSMLLFSC